ncbi:hypothetical protein BC829DRAFT_396242 [Chytridium lagenaria]|nr:hypothetical protein BC829DRAFT_396242 [Chytridium lagenaria]
MAIIKMSSVFSKTLLVVTAIVFMTIVPLGADAQPRLNGTGILLPRLASVVVWDPTKGALRYDVGVRPMPFVRAGVFRNVNASLVGNAMSTFALSVGIARVVEYNDTITLNQSTSFVDFTNRQNNWSAFTFSNATQADGVVNRTISSTFSAPQAYPNFQASFIASHYMNERNISGQVNNSGSLPFEIKFSFGFSNFDYKYQNSSLALVQLVFSEKKRNFNSTRNARNATRPRSIDFEQSGIYNWVGEVIVDGGAKAEIAADPEFYGSISDTTRGGLAPKKQDTYGFMIFRVALNGTRARSLFWDPTLAVTDTTEVTDLSSTSGPISTPRPSKAAPVYTTTVIFNAVVCIFITVMLFI